MMIEGWSDGVKDISFGRVKPRKYTEAHGKKNLNIFPYNSVTFRGSKNSVGFFLCGWSAWIPNNKNNISPSKWKSAVSELSDIFNRRAKLAFPPFEKISIEGVDNSPLYATLMAIHPHVGPRTQIRGRMAPRGLKPAGFFFQNNFGELS